MKNTIWWVIFIIQWILHLLFIIANLLSIIVLPFLAPWYISIPLISFIARMTYARSGCPLTAIENKMREYKGWKKIGTFIGHYLMKRCYCYKAKQEAKKLKRQEFSNK